MIDPKPGDEGKWVTYIPRVGDREAGIISTWNKHFVFVKYHSGDTGAGTLRSDLEWGLIGNVRNRITSHWEIYNTPKLNPSEKDM